MILALKIYYFHISQCNKKVKKNHLISNEVDVIGGCQPYVLLRGKGEINLISVAFVLVLCSCAPDGRHTRWFSFTFAAGIGVADVFFAQLFPFPYNFWVKQNEDPRLHVQK
jgi:hypothetical protein